MNKKLIMKISLIVLFVVGIMLAFIVNFMARPVFNIIDLIALIIIAIAYFLINKFWK